MAFQAQGTDYTGMLRLRAEADTKVTQSIKARKEREAAEAAARSRKRSGIQKLGSAVVRGAAAYYTGGLSETMGGGQMIDKAILGADAETNEYGELVGMASQVGGAMSAQKAAGMAQKLAAQSKRDNSMQERLDILDPSGELGMNFALKREKKDAQNHTAMQNTPKSFGGLMNQEIKGVDVTPTTIGDWESQVEKNQQNKKEVTQAYRPADYGKKMTDAYKHGSGTTATTPEGESKLEKGQYPTIVKPSQNISPKDVHPGTGAEQAQVQQIAKQTSGQAAKEAVNVADIDRKLAREGLQGRQDREGGMANTSRDAVTSNIATEKPPQISRGNISTPDPGSGWGSTDPHAGRQINRDVQTDKYGEEKPWTGR